MFEEPILAYTDVRIRGQIAGQSRPARRTGRAASAHSVPDAPGRATWNEPARHFCASLTSSHLVSATMKFAIALLGLSAAVMVVMISQAVVQEMKLRKLKTQMSENTKETETKEKAIVTIKKQVNELKKKMESANTMIEELKKKKGELEQSKKDSETNLQNCKTVKARRLLYLLLF